MEETNFFDKVYEVAKQIPYGRVTSYGAIAKYLGAARSARMVGWAMNNSLAKDVPAHRVVNRVGVLTGKHHFDGTNPYATAPRKRRNPNQGQSNCRFSKILLGPCPRTLINIPEDATHQRRCCPEMLLPITEYLPHHTSCQRMSYS
jgi:methylated-DNA-protein-cysteine methyltransferase-like protein